MVSKMTNKSEVEQLLKKIKEYSNDMLARNQTNQQISDSITKWENRNIKKKIRILESQDYLTKLLNLESFNKNLSKIW